MEEQHQLESNEHLNVTTKQEELFMKYYKLVPYITNQISNRVNSCLLDIEDLISSGYIALWEAAQKYQQNYEVTFSAYVTIRIRGAILDHIRKYNTSCNEAYKIAKQIKIFAKINSHDSYKNLEEILEKLSDISIMYNLLVFNHEFNRTEQIAFQNPEEAALQKERSEKLNKLINKLPKNEQDILKEHYLKDKPFIQIIAEYGITKSWASKLHKSGLNRLKKLYLEDSATKDFI